MEASAFIQNFCFSNRLLARKKRKLPYIGDYPSKRPITDSATIWSYEARPVFAVPERLLAETTLLKCSQFTSQFN